MRHTRLLLLCTLIAFTLNGYRRALPNQASGPSRRAPVNFVNSLPLSFEPNVGQTDASVDFLARGNGYAFFSSSQEAVLSLREDGRTRASRLVLVGSRTVAGKGEEQLPGLSNYFLGNDLRNWHRNVPQYAKVRYKNVYPRVDVLYHGHEGQIENDFVLSPGSDAKQILMRCEGADPIRINTEGNLLLHVQNTEIVLQKPVAYEIYGNRHRPIAADYVVEANGQISFELGRYDHQHTLVIDPVLLYSTYVGGSKFDAAFGVATDAAGNAYITGETSSTDFPKTTTRAFQGADDVFVAKLNSSGTALLYSTYLGGSNKDQGFAIAVDKWGNAYVAGATQSTNFPTLNGFQSHCKLNSSNQCQGNAVVVKLNSTGSLVYSTYLGGSGSSAFLSGDTASGIAVDSLGYAYVTGSTDSHDFPTTAGAFQTQCGLYPFIDNSCGTAFVTKIGLAGNTLIYSTFVGGSFGEGASGIAVKGGVAYITGSTNSTDFPTTPGAYEPGCPPVEPKDCFYGNAFVTKLNAGGSGLVASTILGRLGGSNGLAIAADASGNAYVTGLAPAATFPTTPGVLQPSCKVDASNSCNDAFVTKLNPTLSALVYSTFLGGTNIDQGQAMAVDSAGVAYVTGYTQSSDFPVTSNRLGNFGGGTCNNAPCSDAFVSTINATGTGFAYYSTFLGGSNADFGNGIALDSKHDAFASGQTASSNFLTKSGSFQTAYHGGNDAFISKLVVAADLAASISPSVNSVGHGSTLTYSITVSNKGPDGSDGDALSDTIPAGTTFVGVTTTNGTCTSPAVGGTGTVVCKRSSRLQPGFNWGPVQLTVKVTAGSGNTITNTTKVSSTTQDLNTTNNAATVSVRVN